MKKNILCLFLLNSMLLCGCGEFDIDKGLDIEWESDDNYHWYVTQTDEETTTKTRSFHTFGPTYLVDEEEYHKCSVCGREVMIVEEPEEDDPSIFHASIPKNEIFEIHTEEQKRFLNYDGDYSDYLFDRYRGNCSEPCFLPISWNYECNDIDTTYSVSISQNKDMENSFEIMGDNNQEINLYNLYLGDNYFTINATKNGITTCSNVYKITVDDTGPRNIYAGNYMTNCRDIGGRKTTLGSTIKQGLLYRTCGNNYDFRGFNIDDKGKRILSKELGIKTEINVGDNNNYNFGLDSIRTYNTYYDYQNDYARSKHCFSRNTESVKNDFEILANSDNYPIAFHCRLGTYRTGLLAILLYGVLGLSPDDIIQDFLFSNFGNFEGKIMIGEKAGEDDIFRYIQDIESMPGENFQEKTYNTLLAIGVPAETIYKVEKNLLEGEIPNNDFGQVVTSVKDMELTYTELISEPKINLTERDNPAYYSCLHNGAEITSHFNTRETGTRVIYAYLGHREQSSKLLISNSIELKVDNVDIAVPETTFEDAGMGFCSERTNYYFVKIGELPQLPSGEHVLKITGIGNDLNIGYVSIF